MFHRTPDLLTFVLVASPEQSAMRASTLRVPDPQ